MLEAAEVVSVSYKDDNPDGLWHLRCSILSVNTISKTSASVIARPINSNFKKPPIPGEVVLLLKGPSNISNGNFVIPEWYYLDTVNVQSSINHNAIPGIGESEAKPKNLSPTQLSYTSTNQGNPNKTNQDNTKHESFIENDEIRPLQPYQGDILLEGRYGQSIRFGSTYKEILNKYSTEQFWNKGKGKPSDPITIIRNGQKTVFSLKPNKNQFINENINYDDSSIYLTSTQDINLAKSSNDTIALDSLKLTKKNFIGKQIALSSDRIILNSRLNEILLFSGGGIGLSSSSGISFDSSKGGLNLSGNVINLGNEAKSKGEPAVLGDVLHDKLDALADIIADVCKLIVQLTVPTGTGPSLTPINSSAFQKIISADIVKLKQKHSEIKSEYVYLKKSADYNKTLPKDVPVKNR